MKRTLKKYSAFLLTLCILLSPISAFASGASSSDNSAIVGVSKAINTVINGAFTVASWLFPKADYLTVEEYFGGESKNFYEGTADFIDEPTANAKWSLGFGKASIVPENLADGSKEYYTGGYFTQKINGVYDDQSVSAIALNDGSERGTAVFAAVDGIGVGNADVRKIRETVAEKLAEKNINNDIIAININSTHCHTVIDTQGFSIEIIPKIFRNMFSWLPFVEAERSIDGEFLDVMIDGASDAIVDAYLSMTQGKLYYFETAGIGRNEEKNLYPDDEYSYLTNKRYGEGYQHFIACFKFVPDDSSISPTIFANLGAHPTTIDRSTSLLSADFPRYIEKYVNENGMNFMFVQGAQSPISVMKTNVENEAVLEKVASEAENDAKASDYQSAKSLGYEFARLIFEACKNAKEVEPMLNINMEECAVQLDKGLFYLAADAQMLGFTTVFDSSSPSGYSLITEVGYIEIGKNITMLTVPGELVPQLVYGNVVGAADAYLGEDWTLEATADIIRKNNPDETVLVMGLCNDAIGYIIPDNDFAPFIADSIWNMKIGDWKLGEALFGEYHRHYEELLSAGGSTASAIIGSLNSIAKKHG